MENGAKGCEVIISGKLRAQRAKAMKFKDGYLISTGEPKKHYINEAVRHVMMRQGVVGIKVKIMLAHDPEGKMGPKMIMPDCITIHEPKEEVVPMAAPAYTGLQLLRLQVQGFRALLGVRAPAMLRPWQAGAAGGGAGALGVGLIRAIVQAVLRVDDPLTFAAPATSLPSPCPCPESETPIAELCASAGSYLRELGPTEQVFCLGVLVGTCVGPILDLGGSPVPPELAEQIRQLVAALAALGLAPGEHSAASPAAEAGSGFAEEGDPPPSSAPHCSRGAAPRAAQPKAAASPSAGSRGSAARDVGGRPETAGASSSNGGAVGLSEQQRLALALRLGLWIQRRLAGQRGGVSGRDENPADSTLYLVFRGHTGQVFDPVLVFRSWAAARALVAPTGAFGQSLFIGLPSEWEARQVVASAGCSLGSPVSEGLCFAADSPDYSILAYLLPTGTVEQLVTIIPVGRFDGKLLVAIPHVVWNRVTKKRRILSQHFAKPIALEVAIRSEEDTKLATPANTKIWMGVLTSDAERYLFVPFDVDTLGFQFVSTVPTEGVRFPLAEALNNAAAEHYTFMSAPSESGKEFGIATPSDVEDRLGRLEGTLESIQDALVRLIAVPATPPKEAGLKPTAKAAGVKRAEPARKADAAAAPGLAPGLVRAARASGVDEATLEAMSALMKKAPPRLGEQPAARARSGPLSESEAEDEEDAEDEDEPLAQKQSASKGVERAISQLTKLVTMLASEKDSAKTVSKLDRALEGLSQSGSGSTESGAPSGAARRSAAALRALRFALTDEPEQIYRLIEKAMGEQVRAQTDLPGVHLAADSRVWLEHRSHVQSYPTTIRWMWAVAGIHSCLKDKRYEEARARTALLLAAGERFSMDGGRWVLAAEILLEQPPPFSSFARHQLPEPTELQRSSLVDPRWIDAIMAKLKEAEDFQERRKRLQRLPTGGGQKVEGREKELEKEKQAAAWKAKTVAAAKAKAAAKVKVPGGAAQSYLARRLWLRQLRDLLKMKGSLSEFTRSVLSSTRTNQKEPSEKEGAIAVWPMPPPYPECWRRSEERIADRAFKTFINLLVVVFSWLHLQRPRVAPPAARMGAPLSSGQPQAVGRLESLAAAWNVSHFVEPSDMGRSALKVEGLEAVLQTLLLKASSLRTDLAKYSPSVRRGSNAEALPGFDSRDQATVEIGHVSKGSLQLAKEVDPSRLNFGGTPEFDPVPLLSETAAARYIAPLDHRLPAPKGPMPKAKVRASRLRQLQLFEKLDSTGRLAIFPYEKRDDVSGLFALVKDLLKDRMILDARPPNLWEEGINEWTRTMASAASLLQIYLEPGRDLYFSGDDLKDYYYYYYFRVSLQRALRNRLSGSWRPSELQHLQCFKPEFWSQPALCVALATMAMGDLNAVEVGQAAQGALAARAAVMSQSEFLTMSGRGPQRAAADFIAGVIIDDCVALSQRVKSELLVSDVLRIQDEAARSLVAARMALLHDAYHQHGLVRNSNKAFVEQTKATFWGAECDGVSGLVRPPLVRVIPRASIPRQVAALGVCTVGLLEILAGCWTSVFQFRTELFILSMVGPIAVTNLRASPAPWIDAVDASNWGEAVARAEAIAADERPVSRTLIGSGGFLLTAVNPADDPTRDRPVREPTHRLPAWWGAAAQGSFELLDASLVRCGLDPDVLSGAPLLGTAFEKVQIERLKPRFAKSAAFMKGERWRSPGADFGAGAGRSLPGPALPPCPSGNPADAGGCAPFGGAASLDDYSEGRCSAHPKQSDCPVLSQAATALLATLPESRFLRPGRRDPNWRPTTPGFLDFYSGQKGVAKALQMKGAPWILTFDFLDGPGQDLLDHETRFFWRPVWTQALFRESVRLRFAETRTAAGFAAFCFVLPASGFRFGWKTPTEAGCGANVNGSVWQSGSVWAFSAWISAGLERGGEKGLCQVLAIALLNATGLQPERKRLDIVSCARACCSRIGEAPHPGPGRKLQAQTATRLLDRKGIELAGVALVEPNTEQLRQRAWDHFTTWIRSAMTAKRCHLLVPQDLLQSELDHFYIKIEKPKTRKRGGAKVQHSKVVGVDVVAFVVAVFAVVPRHELLYPGSASYYRRRWDAILKALEGPSRLTATAPQ
ncbi:unnamed protein product [Polarella glacialis]|uniref:40S ribosomal protein S3 n=1 Tax=Polarella glacialis TaxID=89957 RepID=A0A813FXM8_POLGL|nr:unnamed protein product [Polarella glacialis]